MRILRTHCAVDARAVPQRGRASDSEVWEKSAFPGEWQPDVTVEVFRFEDGQAVEYWDTTQKIAPQSEWKNDNGKF